MLVPLDAKCHKTQGCATLVVLFPRCAYEFFLLVHRMDIDVVSLSQDLSSAYADAPHEIDLAIYLLR